ncbi:hypothetical protein COB28_04720 [Candidatus Dependentiae bacterium]|nr:MAG: hypothetical protein COB28_04720 [Candidatus Dependentiae bacterium]
MITSFIAYFPIIKHLLHADFLHFKKEFLNKCIDRLIWMSLIIALKGYFMAAEFNISGNIGLFTLGSALASTGLLEVYYYMFILVQDFEGEQTITYYLNLPLPASLYMIKQIIYYAFRIFVMGLPIIFIGKMLLWNSFDLYAVHWMKLITIFFLSSFLYGSMSLFFASIVPNLQRTKYIFIRFIFPIWFFGGFMHSWITVYKASPILGYLALLNPVTYVMEGTRDALQGTQGALSFSLCIAGIIMFTILSTCISLYKLKKRLDWV